MTPRSLDKKVWKDAAIKHFERWAEHYDRDIINVLLFQPCYRRVLCQLRQWRRRDFRPLRLLDVGCGTGSLALRCFAKCPDLAAIVGLDMSENMISKAQAKANHLNPNDRLRFLTGDAENLPFPDNSFDVVTCCNSFHHYPHQSQAVREMHRVLAPGGRLMLLDGYRDDPIGFVIFDIFVTRAENHVLHCSAARFRRLLDGAGFKTVTQHVFGVCPPAIMNVAHADK